MTFLRGPQAAALVYDSALVTRRGAMPPSVMSIFAQEWRAAVARWSRQGRVTLHPHAQAVLAPTAMRFAGIDVGPEARHRGRELAAMVDEAGSPGPANWWARTRRLRAEAWARHLVRDVRQGRSTTPAGSPLHIIATHRDHEDRVLPDRIAAVELLNVLRPTVAVARFVTFAAHALTVHPAARERSRASETERLAFVQEVRRLYPFFPVVPGRLRRAIVWRGEQLPRGAWVMLDLYGTDHDPHLWAEPESFDPSRFLGRDGDPNTLVAQGAGDLLTGHRCPGELPTVAIMAEAVRLLTEEMSCEVPAQDLGVPLDRFPTAPRDGMVLARVRAAG